MLPLTKGHFSDKDTIVLAAGVSLLKGDYCILYQEWQLERFRCNGLSGRQYTTFGLDKVALDNILQPLALEGWRFTFGPHLQQLIVSHIPAVESLVVQVEAWEVSLLDFLPTQQQCPELERSKLL